mmetsp:Transcript_21903/g.47410  ORF Transcript_21903/g.47410 Transcript_21903/m.47410 type:complete len:1052 (-) Transcript_21903:65-3220(-)
MEGNVGLSYILTLAVVTYTRFAWLPWMVIHLHQRKYNSWTTTVSAYGLLLSGFQLGHYLGEALMKARKCGSSAYSISFMTLTASFMATCFVTRYILLLLLFIAMGTSSAILSGVSIGVGVDKYSPSLAFLKRPNDMDAKGGLERRTVAFAFVVLASGYLYRAEPLVASPVYFLALLLALFCILLLIYYGLMSRMVKRRAQFNSAQQAKAVGGLGGGQPVDLVEADSEEQYDGPVPPNFYSTCRGSIVEARKMYAKTLAWRRRHQIDRLADIPQQHFHDILRLYPHAIHGYSLEGSAVVYELLGKGNMSGAKKLGVTPETLIWHFALRNELAFNTLLEPAFLRSCMTQEGSVLVNEPPPLHPNNPGPDEVTQTPVRRVMTVLDVGGISISALNADVINFIKISGEMIDSYYPEQVQRLVIVNAPRWFSSIWTVLARVLPESVQKKIDILYDSKGLDAYIHPSQRPQAYGGTDVDLGQGAGHLEFLAIERRWQEMPAPSAERESRVEGTGAKSTPDAKSRAGAGAGAGSGGSDSVMGWVRKQFQATPSAYLGGKNEYRFNSTTGTWDFDVEQAQPRTPRGEEESHLSHSDSDGEGEGIPFGGRRSGRRRRLTKEQLEEHGLVLAIQAAHLAATFSTSRGGAFVSEQQDQEDMGLAEQGIFRVNHGTSGAQDDNAPASRSKGARVLSDSAGFKLSAPLFLLVLAIYLLSHWIYSSLLTLIPVWIVIPASAGGLEYTVSEVALVLSSSAMQLLVGQSLLGSRCDHVLKSSPVRTLRIASGVLIAMLFLLPWFLDYVGFGAPTGAPATGPVLSVVSVFGKVLESHTPLSYSTFMSADHHNVAYDYVHWASSSYAFPHRSLLALQVPALLLALLVGSLHMFRKAAGVLLHLTLSSAFSAPEAVRHTLSGFMDICCPALATVLFSAVYGLRLHYPMDASGFFAVAGCTAGLVYIGSLFLTVHFRGDYGVMTDSEDAESTPYGAPASEAPSGGAYKRSKRHSEPSAYQPGRATGTGAYSSSSIGRALAVPLGDLRLLFSSSFSAYGSKLYNLKDDFKDV